MWCRNLQTFSCLRLLAWTQTVVWRGHEKRECSLPLCTLPILILEQVQRKTQLGSSVAPDVEERVVWQGDCSLQPHTVQFHSRGREAQGIAGSHGRSLQGSQLGELSSCAPLAQALKGMDFTESNAKEVGEHLPSQMGWIAYTYTDCTTAYPRMANLSLVFYGELMYLSGNASHNM